MAAQNALFSAQPVSVRLIECCYSMNKIDAANFILPQPERGVLAGITRHKGVRLLDCQCFVICRIAITALPCYLL